MNQDIFKSVLEHLGVKLVQYILNYNGNIEYHSPVNNYNFTEQQEFVLTDLHIKLLECGILQTANPLSSMIDYTAHLKKDNESLYNYYRSLCGGNVLQPHSKDLLINFIVKKAIDIYPSLLINQRAANYNFSPLAIPRFLTNDQDTKIFNELWANDELLSRLIEEYDRGFLVVRYNLDNGLVISALNNSICDQIIIRSFLNCCYKMAYNLEDLVKEVQDEIQKLKQIASGKEIEFSSYVGIYGLHIEDSDVFQLSEDCVIRNIDSPHNPIYEIRKTASILAGKAITLGGILELKYKAKGIPLGNTTAITFTDQKLKDTIRNLKFAVVFSLNATSNPIKETFQDISFPLTRPGHYFETGISEGISGSTIVENEKRDVVKEWFKLLGHSDLNHIKVPIKRLQYAIFQRHDAEDAILDAFIAWEGIFSEKFETTFQVTGAIARFLKEDKNERKEFLKRLKDLYSFRSNLAHGEPEEHELLKKKKENISELRTEIIEIGINCLKKLLNSPELLNIKPKERIRELLILS